MQTEIQKNCLDVNRKFEDLLEKDFYHSAKRMAEEGGVLRTVNGTPFHEVINKGGKSWLKTKMGYTDAKLICSGNIKQLTIEYKHK